MLQLIKSPQQPFYSLFVPFTRLWAATDFLASLDAMDLPRGAMEVVFYNDTRDQQLQQVLHDWLAAHVDDFNGAALYQSENVLPNEFDVAYRRERICAMKETSKELLADSRYVFCLEDDTLAPSDAFQKLIGHIISDETVAQVSGVEIGRWAQPMVGAWYLSPLDSPLKVESAAYRDQGLQEVDGVGMYCYLTPTQFYKAARYRQDSEAIGPDVVYGWDLRRQGYKVLLDWSIPCTHLREDGTRLIPGCPTTVTTWHKHGNNWVIEDKPLPPLSEVWK